MAHKHTLTWVETPPAQKPSAAPPQQPTPAATPNATPQPNHILRPSYTHSMCPVFAPARDETPVAYTIQQQGERSWPVCPESAQVIRIQGLRSS